MKKGEIIKGKKRGRDKAYHFIIYLSGSGKGCFIGAVLTHSSRYIDNVLMKKEHFKEHDAKGQDYDFIYDNTCLVKHKFVKLESWGPFKKIGELTESGIAFVDSEITSKEYILWCDYVKLNN